MDDRKMGMPVTKETEDLEKKGKGGGSFKWYSMLPREDGKKANNRLYFALFRPSIFTHFNGVLPEDLYAYYFKIPVHYLYDPEEGRSLPIMCINGVNGMLKDLQQRIGAPVIQAFPNQKCKYCEINANLWKKANERREMLGGKNVEWKVLEQDEEWMVRRNMARSFTAVNRFYFLVLDVDKLMGRKAIQEGEVIQMQLYNGCESVFKGLAQKYELGYKFWDVDSPLIIVVARDNKDGARRPDYILDIDPEVMRFSKEVRELVLTEQFFPDLGAELVYQTEEEQIEMLSARDDISVVAPEIISATPAAVTIPAETPPEAAATPAMITTQPVAEVTTPPVAAVTTPTVTTSLAAETPVVTPVMITTPPVAAVTTPPVAAVTTPPVAETPVTVTTPPVAAETPVTVTTPPVAETPVAVTTPPVAAETPVTVTTPPVTTNQGEEVITTTQTLLEKLHDARRKNTNEKPVEIGGKSFRSF